jgi:hypothetical protein
MGSARVALVPELVLVFGVAGQGLAVLLLFLPVLADKEERAAASGQEKDRDE